MENKEALVLSRKLATLNVEIGVDIDLQSLKARHIHAEECVQFFKELDFHSLLKHPAFANKKRLEYSVKVPASMAELREIVKKNIHCGLRVHRYRNDKRHCPSGKARGDIPGN